MSRLASRAAALLLAGAALLSPGASPAWAADAPSPTPAGARTLEVPFGGLTRRFGLLVPSSLAPGRPAPVVVVLHGGLGSGAGAARQGGWDAAAERHGFVAVLPDGVLRSWNAGSCCGPARRRGVDDVGFVRAVLDRVAAELPVDPRRVYATGISNGGMMSYRLACEAADRFAAVAPVAATLLVDPCLPSRPVSLLHVHGLADRNVPVGGGRPTRSLQASPPDYPPVRDGVARVARADGCARRSSAHHRGPVTTRRWLRCPAGTAVELVTVAGGGHSWPGGERMATILDPPSPALDATERIWAFFAAHPRR